MRLRVVVASVLLAGCDRFPREVEANDRREYDRIVSAQRKAVNPDLARRGQEVFLSGPCMMCHTVRGTTAMARVGPDLTHVASRRTLAAGTLLNTRGHLTGWILNPQNLKPGTQMPPTLLPAEDLHAVVAFLETLR